MTKPLIERYRDNPSCGKKDSYKPHQDNQHIEYTENEMRQLEFIPAGDRYMYPGHCNPLLLRAMNQVYSYRSLNLRQGLITPEEFYDRRNRIPEALLLASRIIFADVGELATYRDPAHNYPMTRAVKFVTNMIERRNYLSDDPDDQHACETVFNDIRKLYSSIRVEPDPQYEAELKEREPRLA